MELLEALGRRFSGGRPARVEPAASPPRIELFEIGDAVTFDLDGDPCYGEIVELNDGENVAIVHLIPSDALVEVSQDELTRVQNDPLSYRNDPPTTMACESKRTTSSPVSPELLF